MSGPLSGNQGIDYYEVGASWGKQKLMVIFRMTQIVVTFTRFPFTHGTLEVSVVAGSKEYMKIMS